MPRKFDGKDGEPTVEGKPQLRVVEPEEKKNFETEEARLRAYIEENTRENPRHRFHYNPGEEAVANEYHIQQQLPYLRRIDRMTNEEIEEEGEKILQKIIEELAKPLVEELNIPEMYKTVCAYLKEAPEELLRLQKDSPRLVSFLAHPGMRGLSQLWYVDNPLRYSSGGPQGPADQLLRERLGADHKVFAIEKAAELKARLLLLEETEPHDHVMQSARDAYSIEVVTQLNRDWENRNEKLVNEIKLSITPQAWQQHEEEERERRADWDDGDSWPEEDETTTDAGETGEEAKPEKGGVYVSSQYAAFVGSLNYQKNVEAGMDEELALRMAAKQGEEAATGTMANIKGMFDEAAGLGGQIRKLPYPVGHVIDVITDETGGKLAEIGDVVKKQFAETEKMIATLEQKATSSEMMTREELLFLYEMSPYARFYKDKDPRIEKIRKGRNHAEDARIIFNCEPDQLATDKSTITEKTKLYVGSLFHGIFDKLRHVEHSYTSFPEREVKRRKVTIGTKSGADLEKELRENNVSPPEENDRHKDFIALMRSGEFGTADHPREIELIHVTPLDLGAKSGDKISKIYQKAQELGLEICPAEIGPYYAQQYDERTAYIAMRPVLPAENSNYQEIFYVGSYAGGEHQIGTWPADPAPGKRLKRTGWGNPRDEFVFILPKTDRRK